MIRRLNPYKIFVLIMSVGALAMLAVESLYNYRISQREEFVLRYADFALCAVFFLDFCLSLYHAENKWKYLVTWGWLDLISSIPAVGVFQYAKAFRIFRIIRLLRIFRTAKILAKATLCERTEHAFITIAVVAILSVAAAIIAVVPFETEASRANIRSAKDAMWWAASTITTIGSNDLFPVSTGGRVVGLVLMVVGICLTAAFTGLVASIFLRSTKDEKEKDTRFNKMEKDIGRIKDLLEGLNVKRVETKF